MRLEGQHRRRPPQRPGQILRHADHGAVAAMHAIEIADGDYGATQGVIGRTVAHDEEIVRRHRNSMVKKVFPNLGAVAATPESSRTADGIYGTRFPVDRRRLTRYSNTIGSFAPPSGRGRFLGSSWACFLGDCPALLRCADPGRVPRLRARSRAMALDPSMPVLVVDDYSTMVRIIRNLLSQLGFADVDDARDGESALVKMHTRRYGLVISDWNMEPMTGYDLLRQVRAHPNLATTPFIMITAEFKTKNVLSTNRAVVNTS